MLALRAHSHGNVRNAGYRRHFILLVACSKGYLFARRIASFAGLANRNLKTVLAGIFDLLFEFWVDTRTRFPLLFQQLPKAGQHEFAIALTNIRFSFYKCIA